MRKVQRSQFFFEVLQKKTTNQLLLVNGFVCNLPIITTSLLLLY